jgi:metallo-beta-lactamase class B
LNFMKIRFLLILIVAFLSISSSAQQSETDRKWNEPTEPFRIIGNVYYVGAAEITSFLIITPQGHILLDGGYKETAPQIRDNIKKLGFKVEDVKFLLNSQAHFDHAGGLAELKRLTGAKLLASAEDKILLEDGGKNDFHFGNTYLYEPVKVDKTIKDGEKIKLGETVLQAVFTPGHTKGCTTWIMTTKENNRTYNVVFVGSTTIPGYKLIGNEKYPTIVADYEKTFRVMKKLRPDVFLASHGSFFSLLDKAGKFRANAAQNPFIDVQGYRDFIAKTEKGFRERLANEQNAKE